MNHCNKVRGSGDPPLMVNRAELAATPAQHYRRRGPTSKRLHHIGPWRCKFGYRTNGGDNTPQLGAFKSLKLDGRTRRLSKCARLHVYKVKGFLFQLLNSSGRILPRPPGASSSGSKVRSSCRSTRAKRRILPPPFPAAPFFGLPVIGSE